MSDAQDDTTQSHEDDDETDNDGGKLIFTFLVEHTWLPVKHNF